MRLKEALMKISNEHLTSFHMPGHKNGRAYENEESIDFTYDITEIPGADHLHDAEGCILETELAISRLYGSLESKILVNGSTVGILSMIMGLTRPGDRILINRNAHKSVYNAIEMHQLTPVYYILDIHEELGIPMGIDIEKFDELAKDVKLCLLTYPTYEGLCYPVERLIKICHSRGIPVAVDEAHGAHLMLHKKGPKSALDLGGDVVVQSFHKTLPAMTQTACLHFGKDSIITVKQRDRVKWFLKSLQTSSPSYILMSSVDQMLEIIEKEGVDKSKALEKNILRLHEALKDLEKLKSYRFDHMDASKFIIQIPQPFYREGIWDGYVLEKRLRAIYGIQVEYAATHMLLFMASISNVDDDFIRVIEAIKALNEQADVHNLISPQELLISKHKRFYDSYNMAEVYVMSAYQASLQPDENVPVEDSIGEISAEYIIPYPPGIPVLVPGERITEEVVSLFPCDLKRIKIIVV